MNAKDYPIFKWRKPHDAIAGTLMGSFHGVGRYNHSLYIVKEDAKSGRGKSWKIWETKELRDALALSPVGTKLRIEFLGIVPSAKNKSRKVMHFKINVNRSGKPLELDSQNLSKNNKRGVVRHMLRSQSSAGPLKTVGERPAHVATTSGRKKKNQIPPPDQIEALTRPEELHEVTVPPPIPPHVQSRESFLEGWKKKIKKL